VTLAVAYLALGGLITLAFGVAYLVRTKWMAAMTGIELPTAGARADYRAIFGGAQVALGLYFVRAATVPSWRAPAIAAIALFALGFGVARMGSLAVDRVRRHPQWWVGALEVLAGLIGLWLLAGLPAR
jgi:hypothetical protein